MATGATARTRDEKINIMALESDILLLSAAIIACTLFILNIDENLSREIIDKLEGLIEIEAKDICGMAEAIFSTINPTDEFTT